MKDTIKNYNDWLNEGLINKIKDMFKPKREIEKVPEDEPRKGSSAFIDALLKQPKMFGIKMDERVKAKIDEICDYINTVLDDDDSREGWSDDAELTSDLMTTYDMGEGSSFDSLFAAWVRDNDNLSVQEQLFLLDTFLDQLKLISDFNKNVPDIHKGKFDVFKLWIVAHGKGKSLEQFLQDSRGTIAGHKYGV